jgi:hypothetical protein
MDDHAASGSIASIVYDALTNLILTILTLSPCKYFAERANPKNSNRS